MKIFYEKDSNILYYEFIKNNLHKKGQMNESLEGFVNKINNKQEKYVFLIDEKRFSYFTFDVQYDFNRKLNISNIKEILDEKKANIFDEYGDVGVFLFYEIEDIYIDGEKKDYIIGNRGKIFFKLNIYFLNYDTFSTIRVFGGNNVLENKNINIYPSSFFTYKYLQKNIQRRNFNMLHINNHNVKLLVFRNGFYYDIKKLNFGSRNLKDVFKYNNVLDLYYKTFKDFDFNDFSIKIINDNLNFYNEKLTNWIVQYLNTSDNLILIANLLKNKFFLNNFSYFYSSRINGYVIPFHFSKNFSKFSKNWDHEEIDVLSFLNNL